MQGRKWIAALVAVVMVVLMASFGHAAGGGNNECPVNYLTGLAWEQEFGYGASDISRCLERRHNLKVVVQINQLYNTGSTTQPYAIANINNIINDYEITHGLERGHDYEMVVVVHGAGGPMVLNNSAAVPNAKFNPFQSQMQDLVNKGIKVYLCQNTARSLNLKVDQLIPGVGLVPSGVSTIIDFQNLGYVYLQP